MKNFVSDVISLKHFVLQGIDKVKLGETTEMQLLNEINEKLYKVTGRLTTPELLENYIVREEREGEK